MSFYLNQQNKKRVGGMPGAKSAPNASHLNEFFSLIRSIAIFFGIAFMLRASVVEAFKIPSSSMEPTLDIGDHILVNKLSYGLRLPFVTKTLFDFRLPKHGDVVVFTLPDDPDTNIIKRVVGLPRDKVEVQGMKLLINDQVYDKDAEHAQWIFGGKKDFGPVTVPEDKVMVLGDNRDQSKDSRFWKDANGNPDPFLDVSRIKGRAFVIYWNSAFKFDHVFSLIR
ncbi:MAG: signal peptidase I [Bdellovibrionota bacterium]